MLVVVLVQGYGLRRRRPADPGPLVVTAGRATYAAMPTRRARLAELVAIAIALPAVANVLTADRLTTGPWVLVVVELAGGDAIGGPGWGTRRCATM